MSSKLIPKRKKQSGRCNHRIRSSFVGTLGTALGKRQQRRCCRYQSRSSRYYFNQILIKTLRKSCSSNAGRSCFGHVFDSILFVKIKFKTEQVNAYAAAWAARQQGCGYGGRGTGDRAPAEPRGAPAGEKGKGKGGKGHLFANPGAHEY